MNRAKAVNFLDDIFYEFLSWTRHVSRVSSKRFTSAGNIRKPSLCPTKTALCTLYYSLVYPYLQYCVIVWLSAHPTNLRRIILLLKRIRIVSKGGFADAHTEPSII